MTEFETRREARNLTGVLHVINKLTSLYCIWANLPEIKFRILILNILVIFIYGVKQGGVISPLLFSSYIYNLFSEIRIRMLCRPVMIFYLSLHLYMLSKNDLCLRVLCILISDKGFNPLNYK